MMNCANINGHPVVMREKLSNGGFEIVSVNPTTLAETVVHHFDEPYRGYFDIAPDGKIYMLRESPIRQLTWNAATSSYDESDVAPLFNAGFNDLLVGPDGALYTFEDGDHWYNSSVGTKEASSGNGYFMGDFTGLEVLMKDKTRFKDEPGNWGFFSFGHQYPLKAAASTQPTANCNDCHAGEADDDYVFTQYYPVLRAAKGSAKSK